MIKDSGERRTFDTGAVRDIVKGKGRCDLMPLDVLKEFALIDERFGIIMENFYFYQEQRDIKYLATIFKLGTEVMFPYIEEREHREVLALLEISKHFEEGAEKYGEYNWQKGIPEKSYIDSAIRHYLKHIGGYVDERHDRAFLWNVLCLAWTNKHLLNKDGE